jgi:hypothetical protein
MDLVRGVMTSPVCLVVTVKHDNVAGFAKALDPAVSERLHAMERQPKRIDVMTVR